jgi:hypothetical protein
MRGAGIGIVVSGHDYVCCLGTTTEVHNEEMRRDAGSLIYSRREGRGVGLMMAEFHGLPVTYKAVGAAVCLAHPLCPLPGWSI